MSDETKRSHPSFGMARIARISGTSQLFGSEFKHHHFMSLEISEAKEHRDLSRTWYFSRRKLIEVWLSESQFCQMIASPNTEGVPVTIRHCQGDPETFDGFTEQECRFGRPYPPAPVTGKQFNAEAEDRVQRLTRDVNAALAKVRELQAKGKAGKGELGEVAGELEMLRTNLNSNMDFFRKQLKEYIETTVATGKAEIEAYAAEMQRRVGLSAMQAPFQIAAPEEENA
jgi:hypothetical protein